MAKGITNKKKKYKNKNEDTANETIFSSFSFFLSTMLGEMLMKNTSAFKSLVIMGVASVNVQEAPVNLKQFLTTYQCQRGQKNWQH